MRTYRALVVVAAAVLMSAVPAAADGPADGPVPLAEAIDSAVAGASLGQDAPAPAPEREPERGFNTRGVGKVVISAAAAVGVGIYAARQDGWGRPDEEHRVARGEEEGGYDSGHRWAVAGAAGAAYAGTLTVLTLAW